MTRQPNLPDANLPATVRPGVRLPGALAPAHVFRGRGMGLGR